MASRAPIEKSRIRDFSAVRRVFDIDGMNGDEAARIAKGQGAQQDGVNDAEQRGVGADSECQSQYRRGREAGIFAQSAQADADVHQQVFHGWPAPGVTALLLNQRDVAEGAASCRGGLFSRHAGGDEFFYFLVEMLANFIGKFVVDAAPRKYLFQ